MADLFTKYNCTNCQEDIAGIRVHCAQCENFDLCLQCFAAGAEIGTHLNNHPYQFMDTGTAILSVFRGKGAWTAREEIRLLDAIEQYGFGNWEDISKHIETKSAEDAKEEYVNKYVKGTIGRHTWTPAQSQRPTLVDHTAEDSGPLGATALQRLPPLDITNEEAAQLGYMPNRDGFEREYDPTAEQLISTMALNVDDNEADYLLKLAHVDMYTRRLRERVRRKRLVRDYQLVSNFFRNRNYAQHPGMSREQKEFRDRFRVFAQFYTANEYDRLLASLEREKELRIRIAELCRYRYNGLTKIDECRHFEQHAAMALHRSTGPYGHGKTDNMHPSTGSHRQLGSSLHSPQHSHRKAETLSVNEANLSSTGPRNTHHIGDPTSCVASLHSKNYLDSCRVSSAPMMNSVTTLGATTTTVTGLNAIVDANSNTNSKALSGNLLKIMKTNNSSSNNNNNNINPAYALQQQSTTISLSGLKNAQGNDVGVEKQKHHLMQALQENNNNNHHNANYNNQQQSQQQQQQQQQHLDAHVGGLKSAVHLQLQQQQQQQLQQLQQRPMSNILRAQIDELKNLAQPLGNHLLSSNEQQLCKTYKLPPTTYLSLKTLLLSGAPVPTHNLTPVEHILRKYFIKVGWLSH